jgi:ribosomal-protein-alanine N-acetyltransferase
MPNNLPYVVQPMSLSDLEQVMAIERASFPLPWSARAFRYEITENEHSIMLVVRPAPRHAGWMAQWLNRFSFVDPGPVLGYAGSWLLVDDVHIATIAVHPEWRGRGLGGLLLIAMLDRGAALGARRSTLEVRVSNQVAQRLYRKYGFEVVASRKRYYADNNEDAYIMATRAFDSAEYQGKLQQCRIQLHARLHAEGVDIPSRIRSPGP